MHRVLKGRGFLVGFVLLSAGALPSHGDPISVIPFEWLCGIQAVRVNVADFALLVKSPTQSEGGLTAEISRYLAEHGVPMASQGDSGVPTLILQTYALHLQAHHYVTVVGRLEEPCSPKRRPGLVIDGCATWMLNPRIAIIPRGDETQIRDLLRSIADDFAFAYERSKMLCKR